MILFWPRNLVNDTVPGIFLLIYVKNMPTTTGMKGGGYYDANSSAQRAALNAFLPWIEESVAELHRSSVSPNSINLLDIGSSEGGNAIQVMDRLIKKIRGMSEIPIWVFFADLPTNDFNHLFANLFPDGKAVLSSKNVYPGVIGGTAYNRLVPSQTLHIATTFNTVGWLDKIPDARVPNHILPMQPGPKAPREGVLITDIESAPFRRQAAEDLYQFYISRAEELVSGGKLLVQVFGRNEFVSTGDGIFDVLSDVILEFVDQGIIQREVYEMLIFPLYYRTLDELLTPIKADPRLSRVFRIDQADSIEVTIPFNKTLEESGDLTQWARNYTGFIRAFTEAVLASALPNDGQRPEILDKIYLQAEKLLASNPARYELHFISVAALLTRS